MTEEQSKDHWTPDAYKASASFVPNLASAVLSWLDPDPEDVILDMGCGDGTLTTRIKQRCASVTGIDASPNLIDAAKKSYGSSPSLAWYVQDCRKLEHSQHMQHGHYTKVFSNAALHWILRDASTRMSVIKAAYGSLKQGGIFVFEMGGAGNVAEVHAALIAAVVHQGLSIEQARKVSPWFFPSEKLMKKMLEDVGFRVEKLQLEYRPTELTTGKDGGIEGWARLMGAQFLESLESESREAAVKEVCETLETLLTHEEDGRKWLGYVRLRALARKI